jgi:SnoaL-like domain
MNTMQDLAERYVAVWNESDTQLRKQRISALWTEDGAHYSPTLEAHGHDGLELRITSSWDKWVNAAQHSFRACADADGHHGSVKFHWEMITPTGEVSTLGFEFLRLAPDGRIEAAYMFVEPPMPRR